MKLSPTQKEMFGLGLSALTPIAGVLLFGWDAQAVMFIVAAETIVLSASLMWLFNYPDREPWQGILMVLVTMPAGFMMLVVLNETYREPRYDIPEMVVDLARITWVALLIMVWDNWQRLRNRLREADRTGVDIPANNRLLLRWLFRVFFMLCAMTWIYLAFSKLNAWSLASILLVKSIIDVAFLHFEQK